MLSCLSNYPRSTMADSQEYQVTARKWRPAEFDSVVGQEHVTQTLKNAIRTGHLHHAYLFSGPRGVGKTTTARILAKALNCQNRAEDLEPCNVCDSCRQITEGRSLDVVEIDGASNNSVEDVRKLRDNAKYPPITGSYKLYVIDEVHMLSTSAFNALLKTLEEPPRHLIFIFATTEPHKVPATILSRCQRFDFRRMQIADIVSRLGFIAQEEGFNVEEDALLVIARKGDGSMRDSQSIFDQVISFCGTTVSYRQVSEALNLIDQEFFFRVSDMIRSSDAAEAFVIVDHIMRTGYDPQEFLLGLAEHLRNYLSVLTTGSTRLIDTAGIYRERYASEANAMEQGDLIRAIHLTLAAQQAVRTSSQPRLRLELVLVQLATMDSTISLTELLRKIDGMPDDGPAPKEQPAGNNAAGSAPTSTPQQMNLSTASSSVLREPVSDLPPAAVPPQVSSLQDLASFPTIAPARPVSRMTDSVAVAKPAAARRSTLDDGDVALAPNDSYASIAAGGLRQEDAPPVAGDPLPSLGAIRQRWDDFVRSCEEMRLLHAALQSSVPSELYGRTIRLYVAEQDLRIIERNREALSQKLQSFYNAPLLIEGVPGAAPAATSSHTDTSATLAANVDHPFVRGLIDVLGAGPL